jgi:hypothetical protein
MFFVLFVLCFALLFSPYFCHVFQGGQEAGCGKYGVAWYTKNMLSPFGVKPIFGTMRGASPLDPRNPLAFAKALQ